jgi:uncharacterized RDD family membrane protein YckC
LAEALLRPDDAATCEAASHGSWRSLMTFTSRWSQPSPPVYVAGPVGLPAGALSGVRTRRMIAICFDLIFVSIVSFGLWLALLVMTLGLSLVILPPLFPFVAFFYNGISVSGRSMATPGMRLLGLQMRNNATGAPVGFLAAAVHAVLFYLSWMFPPVFLWSLFAADKRCLHDIFADVIVIRRL